MWVVQMDYKAYLTQDDAMDPEYWCYHVFAETEEEAIGKVVADRVSRMQPPEAAIRRAWESKAVIW